MPQPYNLTNITGSHGIMDLAISANQLVDGMFGILIIVAVWLIVFVASKRFAARSAFFPASFVTFLVTMTMFLIGMVSQTILMMSILVLGMSLVMLRMDSS